MLMHIIGFNQGAHNPHNLTFKESNIRNLFLMFYPLLQWAEICDGTNLHWKIDNSILRSPMVASSFETKDPTQSRQNMTCNFNYDGASVNQLYTINKWGSRAL